MPPAVIRRLPHARPTGALVDERPRLALVASDREWAARALEVVLIGDGYATLRARTVDQTLALCAAADPDVVFLEERLADGVPMGATRPPEPGGRALCRRLREGRVVSEAAPIVLTTADAVRRADVLDALAAGAWELCAIPGDSTALLARCALWVRAKRHADRALARGLTDHETGLYNFQGLIRRAREAAALARRADGPGVLACVAFRAERAMASMDPLDGSAGTATDVARQISEVCAAVGRAGDVFARVGPRDFAILAPGASADGARRLADRLRRALTGRVVLTGRAEEPARSAGGRDGASGDGGPPDAVTIRATAAAAQTGAVTEEEAVDVVVRAVAELYMAR